MENTEKLLTIEEIMEFLNIKLPHIRLLIKNKRIPYFKVGHLIRFRMSDIEDWLKRNKS